MDSQLTTTLEQALEIAKQRLSLLDISKKIQSLSPIDFWLSRFHQSCLQKSTV